MGKRRGFNAEDAEDAEGERRGTRREVEAKTERGGIRGGQGNPEKKGMGKKRG